MIYNTSWMSIAKKELGVTEISGDKNNNTILEYFKDSGHPEISNDETAWCAAFVGAILKRAGIKNTGSLMARSYLNWGEKITEPMVGCVTILWRDVKDSSSGHVGFYVDGDETRIKLLGGNQSNKVSEEWFPRKRVLGYRNPANIQNIFQLNSDVIKKLCPNANEDYVDAISNSLELFDSHGVNTKLRLAHFLAQAFHESGGLRITAENGNYSAQRLLEVFPKHFSAEQAESYAHKPENILNRAYADRLGNGDEASGDGFRYRGRGLGQLTGKENYRRAGDAIHLDLLFEPDLAAVGKNSLEIFLDDWGRIGLNAWADKDDLLSVSKGVNCGSPTSAITPNGMKSRAEWLSRVKAALSAPAKPEITQPNPTQTEREKMLIPLIELAEVVAPQLAKALSGPLASVAVSVLGEVLKVDKPATNESIARITEGTKPADLAKILLEAQGALLSHLSSVAPSTSAATSSAVPGLPGGSVSPNSGGGVTIPLTTSITNIASSILGALLTSACAWFAATSPDTAHMIGGWLLAIGGVGVTATSVINQLHITSLSNSNTLSILGEAAKVAQQAGMKLSEKKQ